MNTRAIKENIGNSRKELDQLNTKRNELVAKMERINDMDSITDSDLQDFYEMVNQVEDLDEKRSSIKKEINKQSNKILDIDLETDMNKPIPGTSGANSAGIETWQNVSNENAPDIKVVGPRAELADARETTAEDGQMAEYLRDRVRGFTSSRSFQNSMDTSVDAALVPEPLSTELIDKARAQSVIFDAGARTVDMPSKNLTIAKVTDDSKASWKKENESHSSSDMGVEPLEFEAKTLIGSVKTSVELAEDSGNMANLVQDNLAKQIALKLDYAALMGSGTDPEPQGIANTPNVQEITLGSSDGGPVEDYSEFSKGVQAINEANGTPGGVIYSPRTWGTVDRLTATDGQPLQAPQSYKDLQKFKTSQVPDDLTMGTSENASLAFIGDFSQLMVGVRTKIRLEVSRFASDKNSNAATDLQIFFRAYARYDIQLAHPEHFYKINGIVPA